jgi:sigma-B regulation protein RsbU (phosphoserine phosphatase)
MARKSGDLSCWPSIEELEILRSTIYHLSEGIIVSDKEGRFLICNQAAQSLLATAISEGAPQAWSGVDGCIKPDGVTPYRRDELPDARALAGETVPETEILIRNEQCPSGIWVSVQANPLRNEAGEIRGSVVIFHDITKKKETDALIQTLTNAVEQTADSIIITDRTGAIEYVNPAFETTTGYTLDELRGLTPRILKSGVHDDSFYEKLWATILSGNVFRNTIANKKKNGEIFYAEQTITPMRGPTGSITQFVTVIKDVTELRKMQEQEIQMSLARAVQQQLYKMPPPQIDGYDFAGSAFPADATGGDYFDFVPLPGDNIGIIIGDVSGHGIGSALLMTELRAYIRAFTQKSADVGEILTLVNNALVSDLELDRYATLIFCRLHPETRTIVYASAGHTPGFIFDAGGEVKHTLDSTDVPLGFMQGHAFSCMEPIQMEPGDFLALLTDGITDAERPDQSFFGVQKALEYIRAHCRDSAQEIVSGLYEAVRDFSDGLPQVDDITAVVCKTLGNQTDS